jgi:hypothetical protein
VPYILIGRYEKRKLAQFKDNFKISFIYNVQIKRKNVCPPEILHNPDFKKRIYKLRKENKKIFNNIDLYFNLLRQSFGDFNEAKTAELQLLNLRQRESVPEYLTRFT